MCIDYKLKKMNSTTMVKYGGYQFKWSKISDDTLVLLIQWQCIFFSNKNFNSQCKFLFQIYFLGKTSLGLFAKGLKGSLGGTGNPFQWLVQICSGVETRIILVNFYFDGWHQFLAYLLLVFSGCIDQTTPC